MLGEKGDFFKQKVTAFIMIFLYELGVSCIAQKG